MNSTSVSPTTAIGCLREEVQRVGGKEGEAEWEDWEGYVGGGGEGEVGQEGEKREGAEMEDGEHD